MFNELAYGRRMRDWSLVSDDGCAGEWISSLGNTPSYCFQTPLKTVIENGGSKYFVNKFKKFTSYESLVYRTLVRVYKTATDARYIVSANSQIMSMY